MRKSICLALFGISFIVCALLYVICDKKSYYYGSGCTICSESLLYNLEPKFYSDYPQRFYLLDADGFELVGIGFRYETTNFTVKGFLAYGYNESSVIVKCTDSLKNIRYLVSYETGYKSKKGSPDVSFKELSSSNFENVKNKYQWVNLEGGNGDRIKLYKTLSFIGTLLSLFLIIRKLFTGWEKSKSDRSKQ